MCIHVAKIKRYTILQIVQRWPRYLLNILHDLDLILYDILIS